jgi:hypothetical protein
MKKYTCWRDNDIYLKVKGFYFLLLKRRRRRRKRRRRRRKKKLFLNLNYFKILKFIKNRKSFPPPKSFYFQIFVAKKNQHPHISFLKFLFFIFLVKSHFNQRK